MPKNIESIQLGTENLRDCPLPVVINFRFPCTWTILSIEDLKQLLREWIRGEELKYPQEKGYKGRWMLFEEIKKVFDE